MKLTGDHDEVLKWLPRDIADALVKAMPPAQRGWYTAAEAENYEGNLIEVTRLCDAEPRFIPGR